MFPLSPDTRDSFPFVFSTRDINGGRVPDSVKRPKSCPCPLGLSQTSERLTLLSQVLRLPDLKRPVLWSLVPRLVYRFLDVSTEELRNRLMTKRVRTFRSGPFLGVFRLVTDPECVPTLIKDKGFPSCFSGTLCTL